MDEKAGQRRSIVSIMGEDSEKQQDYAALPTSVEGIDSAAADPAAVEISVRHHLFELSLNHLMVEADSTGDLIGRRAVGFFGRDGRQDLIGGAWRHDIQGARRHDGQEVGWTRCHRITCLSLTGWRRTRHLHDIDRGDSRRRWWYIQPSPLSEPMPSMRRGNESRMGLG